MLSCPTAVSLCQEDVAVGPSSQPAQLIVVAQVCRREGRQGQEDQWTGSRKQAGNQLKGKCTQGVGRMRLVDAPNGWAGGAPGSVEPSNEMLSSSVMVLELTTVPATSKNWHCKTDMVFQFIASNYRCRSSQMHAMQSITARLLPLHTCGRSFPVGSMSVTNISASSDVFKVRVPSFRAPTLPATVTRLPTNWPSNPAVTRGAGAEMSRLVMISAAAAAVMRAVNLPGKA
jgi:hypothetical protein